ncbi:TPA: fimbria/pilus periplasmic chaperone, partial [Citrobacter amalonaticus]|nr:fimbria/pilus periplasmic chaperone [Citrobacter amalonaticus]
LTLGGTRLIYDATKKEASISLDNRGKSAPQLVQAWVSDKNRGRNNIPFVVIGEIYVPWQKLCHFVRWPLRQHAQDISEVGFRIDAIQSARSEQTIQQGSTLATMIAAEEDVVFLAKTDRS